MTTATTRGRPLVSSEKLAERASLMMATYNSRNPAVPMTYEQAEEKVKATISKLRVLSQKRYTRVKENVDKAVSNPKVIDELTSSVKKPANRALRLTNAPPKEARHSLIKTGGRIRIVLPSLEDDDGLRALAVSEPEIYQRIVSARTALSEAMSLSRYLKRKPHERKREKRPMTRAEEATEEEHPEIATSSE